MSEAKPAVRKPTTKKTGAPGTIKGAGSSKDIDKKEEPSAKSIKEKSSGDLKVTKQGGLEKSSKSLLVDGASEKSSPRLGKGKDSPIPIDLITLSNKISKQLQELALEFDTYLNQELTLIYTDQEVKTALEKSHNFARVQECLLSSGLLGVSSAFTALHGCLSQFKSLMRGKSKKESKDMPTTPAAHKSTVEKLEAEIKAYFGAKLKEEEAAKRKGVEVLTTGDFDQQKFERALSASSLRAGQSKPSQGSSPAAPITRERWHNITPISFSTVENPGSLQKKATKTKLRERLEEYKEMFELNFQKAFNFKPLDAIYAVRQEFNDPLNTLTICGFSINSKGKIIDYNLSSGSIAQEHSNDCRWWVLTKALLIWLSARTL